MAQRPAKGQSHETWATQKMDELHVLFDNLPAVINRAVLAGNASSMQMTSFEFERRTCA